MGVIKDRVDEAFKEYSEHKDLFKLFDNLLDQACLYRWPHQQDMFASYAKTKLEEMKNERN